MLEEIVSNIYLVDWKIILRPIFKKRGHECGLDSPDPGWGPMAGSFEHCNKLYDSLRNRVFFLIS
jgi:hypothetical protein